MKSSICFVLSFLMLSSVSVADERSFQEISASIEAEIQEFRSELGALPDDIRAFEKAQDEEIARLRKMGLDFRYVSYQEYETNKSELHRGIGRDYDGLAVRLREGDGQEFFTSVSSNGYRTQTDDRGNVIVSSGNCGPCPPTSHTCSSEGCPGSSQFQEYNRGRSIGDRVFGPGYNGRTLKSTMREAPLLRPYLFTHAFRRLQNPTRIGQGRILNFLFPRIRYKNGHICSIHDMKVHLGRRQWAIIIGTSFIGGGGGAVVPIFLGENDHQQGIDDPMLKAIRREEIYLRRNSSGILALVA